MELVITLAVVLAAAGYVITRWVRSARRALRPPVAGICGGGCAGCAAASQLRQRDGATLPTGCAEHRKTTAPSPGAPQEADHV
jgi:hypothetical protein